MILRLVIFLLRRALGLLLAIIVGGILGPTRLGRRILRSASLLRRLIRL